MSRSAKRTPAPADIDDAIAEAQAQATAAHFAEELAAAGITFAEWRKFMAAEPPPFDWIIDGVVAKGMKGDLLAKSKRWKSFFAMQLALCVSAGIPFLGMDIPRARRCAYFNLELHPRGIWERFETMGAAIGTKPAPGMLHLINLRGRADRLREHTDALVAETRQRGIDLVVLDPRYKIIADGEDENSADGLRGVLQFRDKLAEVAAVMMVGHDPKGDVAGKSMADRGAGSYTAGADFDFAFALTPHVDEEYTVLSTSCRYRQSPPDVSLLFDTERQIFTADADKPALVKNEKPPKSAREKAARQTAKLQALETAARELIADGKLRTMRDFRLDLSKTEAGQDLAFHARREAVDAFLDNGGDWIKTTPELERKADGVIRQTKRRSILVGTPEAIRRYNDKFTTLL